LVEDYELSFRLYRKKYRILFVPLSIVHDEHPPTLQLMIRQRARWAKGFIDLLNQRIAEPTDILGHIYGIYPIVTLSGAMMLAMVSYVSIYNLVFGYLPFAFSILPLQVWFFITGLKPIPNSYPQLQGKIEAYNKIVKNEFISVEDISSIDEGTRNLLSTMNIVKRNLWAKLANALLPFRQ
jgi:hypothetical protein